MKRMICIVAATALLAGCAGNKAAETPKSVLSARLSELSANGKIAYGHQDDLSYGHAWKVDDWRNDPLDRSDVKDVTGKYPMVVGFDLGGIEMADSCNLDGVPFGLIRKGALAHIGRGGIVTFSWHPRNPYTGETAWDVSSDKVVSSILPGGEKHDEFMVWLQRAADFVESLGSDVSVIFRPWHENIASWFWWGGKLCSADEYKALYRLTREYFEKERGIENLLWCYSPNGNCTAEEFMERYPGDDIVDMLGIDTYEYISGEGLDGDAERFNSELSAALTVADSLAKAHGKLLCLSETGIEGIPDQKWWTERLEPVIRQFPVSYVLTWRNAWDKPGHFYAAWKGLEGEDDFKAFSELDNIVFLD